jgi:hypothetical protein
MQQLTPSKQIAPEKLDQIIGAISSGKYSWACVLMLRALGENPLHYIPQRTYTRVMRENRPLVTTK